MVQSAQIIIPKQEIFKQIAMQFDLSVTKTVVRDMQPNTYSASTTITTSTTLLPAPLNEAVFYGDFCTTQDSVIDSACGEAIKVLSKEWKLHIIDYNHKKLIREQKKISARSPGLDYFRVLVLLMFRR